MNFFWILNCLGIVFHFFGVIRVTIGEYNELAHFTMVLMILQKIRPASFMPLLLLCSPLRSVSVVWLVLDLAHWNVLLVLSEILDLLCVAIHISIELI